MLSLSQHRHNFLLLFGLKKKKSSDTCATCSRVDLYRNYDDSISFKSLREHDQLKKMYDIHNNLLQTKLYTHRLRFFLFAEAEDLQLGLYQKNKQVIMRFQMTVVSDATNYACILTEVGFFLNTRTVFRVVLISK